MQPVRPCYVPTPHGAVRAWLTGDAVRAVVLPGLIRDAASVAQHLATLAVPFDAAVLDLPGTGGSDAVGPLDLPTMRAALCAAIDTLGLAGAPVLALDAAAALVAGVGGPPVLIGLEDARGWADTGMVAPDTTPRHDGTHLAALHAFLRDRHVLDAAAPWRAAAAGDALPNAAELHAAVVSLARRPGAYAALWAACMAALPDLPQAADWEAALNQVRGASPRPVRHAADADTGLRSGYADLPGGRMHVRRAGPRGVRPLIALHSAPGSAAPLRPLIEALSTDREVIAPDYLGNGESDKPPGPTTIAALGQDIVALADALGLARFDLWGTHTGALIALEAALHAEGAAPGRVGRVVLEGPVLLPPALNGDILAHYFPPLRPDPWGLHLLQAWNMRRDMFLFWPWFRAERGAARPLGIPDPAFLHDWTIGLLQSGASYDRSYRAAFEYDTRARLPLLPCPSLVCAGRADMLVGCLDAAKAMALPRVTVQETPATVWYPNQSPHAVAATIAAYRSFLDAPTTDPTP